MLTIVNTPAMTKPLNSATVGALVREARAAAGLSQTDLGQRIGASRFWVAQFEKGKPGAELGLALKAMYAIGLTINIEPQRASRQSRRPDVRPRVARTDLAKILAHATLANSAPSSVIGWPTASLRSERSRKA